MITAFDTFRISGNRIIYSFISSLLIALLLGCTYHDVKLPRPCSCEIPAKETFQSLPGIMVNTTDGFMLLSISKGFYKSCNDLDSSLLTDGLMLEVNGRLKTTCLRPGDTDANPAYNIGEQQGFVIFDNWQIHQDSILNTSTLEIHIIRSEDYGYPPGFGIKILSIKGDLFSPGIPGVGRTFKTPTDAFKVAVLIMYKSYLKQPLWLTMEDLIFLKIDLS